MSASVPGRSKVSFVQVRFLRKLHTKNVVHELTCQLCQENGQTVKYIDETNRPVRLRFNEHLRDTFNGAQDTPMGNHFRESHLPLERGTVPLKISILYRSRDHPDRKIAESLLIQSNRPQLNSNLSSWPIL